MPGLLCRAIIRGEECRATDANVDWPARISKLSFVHLRLQFGHLLYSRSQ